MIFDGTDVDHGAKLINPDPGTNFTTYLKVWEDEEDEEDEDVLFKGRDSVMSMLPRMLPPQVMQQLFG